jgi:anti-sigma regulatory factor (Ser/Thr protein kinase)
VWTLVSATPVFDEEHNYNGSFAMLTDITEAKRTQEELRKRDRAIRRAYVDVIAAVTGNKLILMTSEEIKDALGELVAKPHRIGSYRSLAKARAEIRTALAYHFPEVRGAQDFIVGVCEGLTNAVKHGGSGRYEVRRCNTTAQVVISDRGPGVDFTTVPKATLEAGFSTQGTLGVGFTIMLEMSDRVLLSTQPGETVLVLEVGKQEHSLRPGRE